MGLFNAISSAVMKVGEHIKTSVQRDLGIIKPAKNEVVLNAAAPNLGAAAKSIVKTSTSVLGNIGSKASNVISAAYKDPVKTAKTVGGGAVLTAGGVFTAGALSTKEGQQSIAKAPGKIYTAGKDLSQINSPGKALEFAKEHPIITGAAAAAAAYGIGKAGQSVMQTWATTKNTNAINAWKDQGVVSPPTMTRSDIEKMVKDSLPKPNEEINWQEKQAATIKLLADKQEAAIAAQNQYLQTMFATQDKKLDAITASTGEVTLPPPAGVAKKKTTKKKATTKKKKKAAPKKKKKAAPKKKKAKSIKRKKK